MNRVPVFLLFCIFSFIVSAASAQKFEGTVKLSFESSGSESPTFLVKDGMVLAEPVAEDKGSEHIFCNAKTGDMYFLQTLDEETKIAVKQSSNGNAIAFESMPAELSSLKKQAEFTFSKTKETRKIDGLNCVKLIAKSELEEGEAWVTKDIDLKINDLMPVLLRDGKMKSAILNASGIDGFIMEMWSVNTESGEEFSMNASVEQKKLSKNLSATLMDYKVLDVNAIMEKMRSTTDPKEAKKLMESEEMQLMKRIYQR